MKIALLAPASSIHTARWVNALCERKADVTLFSLDIEKDETQNINAGARVVYIKSPLRRFAYVAAAPVLRRLLKRGGYDVVNAHYASSYGLLARMAGAKPLVLSVWGSDVYAYPYISACRGRILRRNLRFAEYISSTSHVMAEQVKRLIGTPKNPITVIPFGVDTELFNRKKPVKHEEIVIGVAKSLEPRYDISCLIRAFAIVADKPGLPPARLVIYGDGSCRHSLERLAAELGIASRVSFMGHIAHCKLAAAMREMDIFALSSKHESFGVAAAEAMAAGLPVVAADIDGFREVLEDGVTGILVPAGDEQSMADAIASLMTDEKRRNAMGGAGRQRVKNLYEWDENVNAMTELYRAAAKAP